MSRWRDYLTQAFKLLGVERKPPVLSVLDYYAMKQAAAEPTEDEARDLITVEGEGEAR
jgi:hypothetical protein